MGFSNYTYNSNNQSGGNAISSSAISWNFGGGSTLNEVISSKISSTRVSTNPRRGSSNGTLNASYIANPAHISSTNWYWKPPVTAVTSQ